MQSQKPQQQFQQAAKKVKTQATEASAKVGEAREEATRGLSSLSERAPELIQDVVHYLEDNWGLRRVEKVAAAIGIGSALDLSKVAANVNWSTIKRRVTAKPVQAAAIAVAVVGIAVLARQLMADQEASSESKLHH